MVYRLIGYTRNRFADREMVNPRQAKLDAGMTPCWRINVTPECFYQDRHSVPLFFDVPRYSSLLVTVGPHSVFTAYPVPKHHHVV